MNVNSNKNKKLIKQFPFIETILVVHAMEPFGSWRPNGRPQDFVDDLTIRVQRADGDLMFRQAHNVGLGDGSFIFNLGGKHQKCIGREAEYLFAIGHDNTILNRLNWPRNREEGRGKTVYGGNVLWSRTSPDGQMLSDSIHDKTAYLVWVTVSAWNEDTGKDNLPGGRFGKFLERSVNVIVFRPPECGFKKLQDDSSVWSNLRLNQDVYTRALVDKDTSLLQMFGCLWELCKFFQEEVWDKGMRQAYESFSTRGASGRFGPAEILVADLCGYHRVMFKDASCWVSFQLRPGGIDMYVLGQDGTLPELRRLVRGMVKMWMMQPECHVNFKSNDKVGMM